MRNLKTVVFDATDLALDAKYKEGTDLSINDLRQKSLSAIAQCDFGIVVTSAGENVVLKNRLGREGVIVPLNTYSEFLSWVSQNRKTEEETKVSFWKKYFKFF